LQRWEFSGLLVCADMGMSAPACTQYGMHIPFPMLHLNFQIPPLSRSILSPCKLQLNGSRIWLGERAAAPGGAEHLTIGTDRVQQAGDFAQTVVLRQCSALLTICRSPFQGLRAPPLPDDFGL